MNIALFASGTGSNALNLWKKKGNYPFLKIKCAIIDQENAGFIKTCQENKIPYYIVPKKTKHKYDHEKEIQFILKNENIDWILLAGYMRILSSDFIQSFYDIELGQARIINIHPSLLPKYQGLNAFERCFEAGDLHGGVTIHFIDSGIDTGKVILQEKFPREEKDSLIDFKKRGQELEHKLYPAFLERLNKYIATKNIKEFFNEN